ncbi:Uncharacterized protein Fot_37645 [Forsythia ovata]|uniref:Uncharacterized protein n=1 Tax=Forsythia ovata TaxID=205694 RepID=A0ABD1S071_9LAMI
MVKEEFREFQIDVRGRHGYRSTNPPRQHEIGDGRPVQRTAPCGLGGGGGGAPTGGSGISGWTRPLWPPIQIFWAEPNPFGSLLRCEISGETTSSTVNDGSLSDLSKLANTSLYDFEDYHGVDIGVICGSPPLAREVPLEIKIKDTDIKLGFAINITEEGFIYISSVIEGVTDTPSSRSGLSNL